MKTNVYYPYKEVIPFENAPNIYNTYHQEDVLYLLLIDTCKFPPSF